jgi:hypothetical protein
MRTRLGYLTPLLGSVATAVAIAAAPIASAAPVCDSGSAVMRARG